MASITGGFYRLGKYFIDSDKVSKILLISDPTSFPIQALVRKYHRKIEKNSTTKDTAENIHANDGKNKQTSVRKLILSLQTVASRGGPYQYLFVCLFVCLFVFVALRPMSTAMVIAGRSVHLTTLFPGQA